MRWPFSLRARLRKPDPDASADPNLGGKLCAKIRGERGEARERADDDDGCSRGQARDGREGRMVSCGGRGERAAPQSGVTEAFTASYWNPIRRPRAAGFSTSSVSAESMLPTLGAMASRFRDRGSRCILRLDFGARSASCVSTLESLQRR